MNTMRIGKAEKRGETKLEFWHLIKIESTNLRHSAFGQSGKVV